MDCPQSRVPTGEPSNSGEHQEMGMSGPASVVAGAADMTGRAGAAVVAPVPKGHPMSDGRGFQREPDGPLMYILAQVEQGLHPGALSSRRNTVERPYRTPQIQVMRGCGRM